MKQFNRFKLLFLIFISFSIFSFTQDKEKVVEIDISESLPENFDTKNVAFMWNMGDSLIEQGLVFKHIYKKPGKYKISMYIKYLDLDVISPNELVFDLYVK